MSIPRRWKEMSELFARASLRPGVQGVIYLQHGGDDSQYLLVLRESVTNASGSSGSAHPNLDQLAATLLQREARRSGCSAPDSHNDGAIAGTPDIWADLNCEDQSQMERVIVVVRGSYVYQIRYVADSLSFASDLSDLNDSLASWRWSR